MMAVLQHTMATFANPGQGGIFHREKHSLTLILALLGQFDFPLMPGQTQLDTKVSSVP